MQIFISYSSKNRDLVKTLAADLKAMGHSVWFDGELSGGQLWWDNILGQIRTCDLFLAALTTQFMASEPCKLERDYAHALDKSILPLLLADGVRVNLLPPELSLLHFVDYRVPNDKMAAIALSRALDSLPTPKPLPYILPQPPAPPINSLGVLTTRVTARTLDFEEQSSLLIEIKALLNDASFRDDALELLNMLHGRGDLFAAIANEIDTVTGTTRQPSPSAAQNIPLIDNNPASDEPVLKEFGANWVTSTVNYAGKIAITQRRLVFQGSYLTKEHRVEILMQDIVEVKKGLALFSVSPTIVIRTRANKDYSFSIQALGGILYGNREEIVSLIQGLIPRS
jgi:hypothetical protein